jgi:hypothetical protein
MTTTTEKIQHLASLYQIDTDIFKIGGEYLANWYEWHEWAITLSEAYSAGYFTLTDSGIEAIDNAYADWLLLTTNDDYKWDWSEFFPFNEWTKPKATIYV